VTTEKIVAHSLPRFYKGERLRSWRSEKGEGSSFLSSRSFLLGEERRGDKGEDERLHLLFSFLACRRKMIKGERGGEKRESTSIKPSDAFNDCLEKKWGIGRHALSLPSSLPSTRIGGRRRKGKVHPPLSLPPLSQDHDGETLSVPGRGGWWPIFPLLLISSGSCGNGGKTRKERKGPALLFSRIGGKLGKKGGITQEKEKKKYLSVVPPTLIHHVEVVLQHRGI